MLSIGGPNNDRIGMTHFQKRCMERGIVNTDHDLLFRGLCWAVEKQRGDLVELAVTIRGADYWRFRCPDGIFYAVVPHGQYRPVTVATQSMMRSKKFAVKRKKQGREHGIVRIGTNA